MLYYMYIHNSYAKCLSKRNTPIRPELKPVGYFRKVPVGLLAATEVESFQGLLDNSHVL